MPMCRVERKQLWTAAPERKPPQLDVRLQAFLPISISSVLLDIYSTLTLHRISCSVPSLVEQLRQQSE